MIRTKFPTNYYKKLGIPEINLTLGRIIKLCRVGGDPHFEECGWGNWEEDVQDLLKMPEDEIPVDFSVELEVTGDDRHFCFCKRELSGILSRNGKIAARGEDNVTVWDILDGVRNEEYPGGWDTICRFSELSFQEAYFNFLSWYCRDQINDLKREKNLSDEVCQEMHNKCKAEIVAIWQKFK